MIRVQNVTGVPITLDGVKGSIRFSKGEVKDFAEMEDCIKEAISNKSLMTLQVVEDKPIQKEAEEKIEPKKGSKKNKEVNG